MQCGGDGGNLEASKSDASRIRLAVEGARTWEAGAGRVTPSIEIGVRHDGGDAETGTGVEIGGGIRYQGAGISIEGAVRSLIAHEEDGVQGMGSIRDHPDRSGHFGARTLSVVPRAELGQPHRAGMDQIWSPRDAHGLSERTRVRCREPDRR